jgi:monoamine oxidase
MQRRNFIQQVAALTGTGFLLSQCQTTGQHKIPGRIVGASAKVGHLLRDKKIQGAPQSTTQAEVVIVGAGVSGLSAARHLYKQGVQDFLVLDLEEHAGGNAAAGENNVSRYPWGAHYVPIPNNDLKDYLSFLQECNVVTGYNNEGLPVYNEYHLCFDPEERLYINGSWQEGLVPRNGVPAEELKQVQRFLDHMQQLRYEKGQDGKETFAIPVNHSSADEQYTQLDTITMKEWLVQQGYTSEYLHWYCNYCCRDDFGTRYDETAAWAGIHYFAARKGKGANAEHQDVLTWPQGNGWLVEQLQKDYRDKIKLNSLVTSIRPTDGGVDVLYMDVATGQLQAIHAKQCVVAIPQFVAQRMLAPELNRQQLVQQFSYAPWMVANITVQQLKERRGEALSWDNVLYNSESLGYVVATHQSIKQREPVKVLTYYLPLTQGDVVTARREAAAMQHEQWVDIILNDLRKVHENIAAAVTNIDVMVWGHGMIRPVKGFIHGEARRLLNKPVNDVIFFAHTDLAGISIFEEGFYQGLQAAEAILKTRSA